MHIRPALLIVAFIPALGAAAAAETATGEWTLQRLMTAMSSASRGKVRFVEERHLQYLTEPLTIEGILSYQSGRLEKHTLKPAEERLVIEGDRLQIISPRTGGRRRVLLSDYPALETFIVGLRATLDGDLETLRRLYWVEFDGRNGAWRISLTPLSDEAKDTISSVTISGVRDRVRAMEIRETGGDRSLIRLIGN